MQKRLAKILEGAPRKDLHSAVLKRVAKMARAAGRAKTQKKGEAPPSLVLKAE